MIIKCKQCGVELTEELNLLEDESLINGTEGVALIPPGFYILSEGTYYTGSEGQIIINRENLLNAVPHFDNSRTNGCCGMDGMDGLNTICINLHEVATDYSDCWIAHAVVFESSAIDIIYPANQST